QTESFFRDLLVVARSAQQAQIEAASESLEQMLTDLGTEIRLQVRIQGGARAVRGQTAIVKAHRQESSRREALKIIDISVRRILVQHGGTCCNRVRQRENGPLKIEGSGQNRIKAVGLRSGATG